MMFGGVFWCLSDSDEPYTGAPLYVQQEPNMHNEAIKHDNRYCKHM